MARLPDAVWTGDIALAVGAVTDGGELVGVGVVSPLHAQWAKALVAVTPARRRLGLGADLLLVLVDGAVNRGLRAIACALDTDAKPAQRLCATLGLRSRIVRSDQGTDVIEILDSAPAMGARQDRLGEGWARPARGGPLTPRARQVLQTSPKVEPVDHFGCEPHRRGRGTMSSAWAIPGGDPSHLAGSGPWRR